MQLQIDKLGKVAVTVEQGYWSNEKDYDRLTIVEAPKGEYKTYISRKPVPAGTVLTNREYWIPFSSLKEEIVIDFNEFVASLTEAMQQTKDYADNTIEQGIEDITAIKEEAMRIITYIADNGIDSTVLAPDSVTSEKIKAGNVLSEHIGSGEVKSANIGAGEVKSGNIGEGEVKSNNIGTGEVKSGNIGEGEVKEGHIAPGAITTEKLDTPVITQLQTIMDDEPTAGSVKPVMSGGVAKRLVGVERELGEKLTGLTAYNYAINTTGKYGTSTSYKHYAIPVTEGERYLLEQGDSKTRYAFAKDHVYGSGEDISLVPGYGVVEWDTGADMKDVITIPTMENEEDKCHYLLLFQPGAIYKCDTRLDDIEEKVGELKNQILCNYIDGKGNSNLQYVQLFGIIPEHIYRVSFPSDWDASEVASTQYKLTLGYKVGDTSTTIEHIEKSAVVNLSYDIVTPAGCTLIYVGVRANVGVRVWVTIEDITITEHIGDVITTIDGASTRRTDTGSSVSSATGTRYNIVLPIKKGDSIWCQSGYDGIGVYVGIWSSLAYAFQAGDTGRLQVISEYTTEPIFGIAEYDGYVNLRFMKSNSTSITDAQIEDIKDSVTIRLSKAALAAVTDVAQRLVAPVKSEVDETSASQKSVLSELVTKGYYETKRVEIEASPDETTNAWYRSSQSRQFHGGKSTRLLYYPEYIIAGGEEVTLTYTGRNIITVYELPYRELGSSPVNAFNTSEVLSAYTCYPSTDPNFTGYEQAFTLHPKCRRLAFVTGATRNVDIDPSEITLEITSLSLPILDMTKIKLPLSPDANMDSIPKYYGNRINLGGNGFNYSLFASNAMKGQSSARWGDYLFIVSDKLATVACYNLATKTMLYILTTGIASQTYWHCNQSSFGKYKYSNDDMFPVLYISMQNDGPDLTGKCSALGYRIVPVLTDGEISSFAISLVQTIMLPTMTDDNCLGNVNITFDLENDYMWGYCRNNNSGASNYNKAHFVKFNIPALFDGSNNVISLVELTDNDIKESFSDNWSMYNAQGGFIRNGNLVIMQGYPNAGYIYCRVIDLYAAKKQVSLIDLYANGFTSEPEGVFFYDGKIFTSVNSAKIYYLDLF